MNISKWFLTVLVSYFLFTKCFKCLSTNVTVFRCSNTQPDYFMQNKPFCSKITVKNACKNITSQNQRHCLQSCTSQQPQLVIGTNGRKCVSLFNSAESWLSSDEKKICRWFSLVQLLHLAVFSLKSRCNNFRGEKMLCAGSWKTTNSSRSSPPKRYSQFGMLYQAFHFVSKAKRHTGSIIKITATCSSGKQSRSTPFCILLKVKGSVKCSMRDHDSPSPRTLGRTTDLIETTASTTVSRMTGHDRPSSRTVLRTADLIETIASTTESANNGDKDNKDPFVIQVAVSCVATAVVIAIIVLFIYILRKRVTKKMKSTEMESSVVYATNEANQSSEALNPNDNPKFSQPTSFTTEKPTERIVKEIYTPVDEQVLDPVPNRDKVHVTQMFSPDTRYKSLLSRPKNLYQKPSRNMACEKVNSHPESEPVKGDNRKNNLSGKSSSSVLPTVQPKCKLPGAREVTNAQCTEAISDSDTGRTRTSDSNYESV